MKILLTHAYSKHNKGDAAIVSVMLTNLKEIFPQAEFVVASMEWEGDKTFEGALVINSLFYLAIYKNQFFVNRIVNSIYYLTISTLWALVYRLFFIRLDFLLISSLYQNIQAYNSADLILPVGGGYLQSQKTFYAQIANIFKLHAITLGLLLKKPTVLFSQSIGPYSNNFHADMTKAVLNHTQGVFVREERSYRYLRNMGVKDTILKKTVDVVFDFTVNKGSSEIQQKLLSQGLDLSKPIVGISVRDWLEKNKQDFFENQMAAFIDYLQLNYEFQVIFIPETTAAYYKDDDRVTARRIYHKLKVNDNVFLFEEEFSHHQIKRIYDLCSYVVGARMHSNIFALISSKPTIAIQYEYKTIGIMEGMGLEKWVINIEEVTTEKLIQLFYQLILNSEDYKKLLMETIPKYSARVKQDFAHLKKMFVNDRL